MATARFINTTKHVLVAAANIAGQSELHIASLEQLVLA